MNKLRDHIEQRIADDPLAAAETVVDVIDWLRFVEARLAELAQNPNNSPTSLSYVRDAIRKLEGL